MKKVIIEMEDGNVLKGELYEEEAPITVENFEKLAKEGFYDGLTFHRIIPDFLIQGGCPYGMGTGGPGYTIKGEFEKNGIENNVKHVPGTISMARGYSVDSAGSQFFIMAKESPQFDGRFAGFGKITEGVEEIAKYSQKRKTNTDKPLQDIVIKTIKVMD